MLRKKRHSFIGCSFCLFKIRIKMKKFEFLWVSDYEPRDVITKIFASREEAKEFLRTLPGSSGAYGYWTFNEV